MITRLRNYLFKPTTSTDEGTDIENGPKYETPYVACAAYYLAVVLFVGVPMWLYTCSATRYSLPNLTELDRKLVQSHPRLHLEISVIQTANSAHTNSHQVTKQSIQADYLRANLPNHIETNIENVTYSINWRIRRPTQEEGQMLKSLAREYVDISLANNEIRQAIFDKLEQNLLKIHKPINRFRLFLLLLDEPLSSHLCDRPQTYSVGEQRFIYLCPSESNESLALLINSVLEETYSKTVDSKKIGSTLSAKTDLLVTLMPEKQPTKLAALTPTVEKLHAIFEKNVKNKYLELAEVLNIRFVTQIMIDILNEDLVQKLMIRQKPTKQVEIADRNESENAITSRIIDTNRMYELFHNFESRLSKHSAQNVHHVLTIITDTTKPPLNFNPRANSKTDPVGLLEERDSSYVLIGSADKSLVLGLRAIVRRVLGLSSANLCNNCVVRRNSFLNSWELDAIVGALTIVKLERVLLSLRSLSQQSIGVKIPKSVSSMAHDAQAQALKSIENLASKKPLEAYRIANSAYELSEAAFYDPSLLETLYFPDESKYAIYTPLFLPLAIPFAQSLIRIFVYLKTILLHKDKEKIN